MLQRNNDEGISTPPNGVHTVVAILTPIFMGRRYGNKQTTNLEHQFSG